MYFIKALHEGPLMHFRQSFIVTHTYTYYTKTTMTNESMLLFLFIIIMYFNLDQLYLYKSSRPWVRSAAGGCHPPSLFFFFFNRKLNVYYNTTSIIIYIPIREGSCQWCISLDIENDSENEKKNRSRHYMATDKVYCVLHNDTVWFDTSVNR